VFVAVRDDLHRSGLPTASSIERLLVTHASIGLRCIGVPGENGPILAGDPACSGPPPRPGAQTKRGGLTVIAAPMPPIPGVPFSHPPPLMVVGFASSVAESLGLALRRAAVISIVAALLLLGGAAFMTRSTLARAKTERDAERARRLVALGEMSSVMAHELRNPLASLKGHAQLLVESLAEGTRERAKAERVVAESERLERLTSDLLDFVRDGPIDRRPMATDDLIERSRDAAPGGDVRVDATTAPKALEIDGARITAALGNLMRNALQASDRPVEVAVRASGRDVTIEVRDHGPGIAPGDEERIFEPFVTDRTRGTGLGLAVARRAVEQHGGTLRGETHPEGGALFRMVLPGAARETA
jgi:two-component system sensor histidine kinase HydH